MDIITCMRMFSRVAEEGNFTAAANRMNTNVPLISRAITALEIHLHTRLFNRTTRRVSLTEAGKRYHQRCEQILDLIDQAEAEAADAQHNPSGHLRIHASSSLGQNYVVPAITRYRQRFADVTVELGPSSLTALLSERNFDVAIHSSATELPDSSLIALPLGPMYSVLCASPSYLRKQGTPHRVEDLSHHLCYQLVNSASVRNDWHFDGPNGKETLLLPHMNFEMNVAEALAVALVEGTGIGALPVATAMPAIRSGALTRVLPEYRLQALTLYILYPSRQFLDAKARSFIDFMREYFPPLLAAEASDLLREPMSALD